ncbi:pre-mycofactocin synthase MftD [Dermacoccaceae bacterium W4C1]
MSNTWFETVAEAQRRAKRKLPRSVYKALLAGSERGLTYNDNIEAFSELGFAPHVAGATPDPQLGTSVLGMDLGLPIIISPTGVQAVHPEGELAVARAAAARGTAMGLSSFGSTSMEEVAEVNDKLLFQIYWSGGRDVIEQRLERAKAAGAKGIIVTLDWTFSYGRDWGSPTIPEALTPKAMLSFAPEVALKPRWLLDFARSGSLPDLTTPNMAAHAGEKGPTFFGAYGEWMTSTPPSWEDIAWMRSQWDGPFVIKGISRVDDARRAVDAGVSGISVSTHGGNNLDGTPGAIRMLPSVAAAVGDEIDILFDSGIRRGGDVVKALALGADAVMIGRAYLWGLAANGQAGVENVLDLLAGGIRSALLGLGKSSVAELEPSDVLVPDGFTRTLGG